MKKILFAASLAIMFQPLAHAQFGDLLKDLKGAVEQIQKGSLPGVQPPSETSSNTEKNASKGTGSVISSEEYCNRFNSSPSVQALSKAMDSLMKETKDPAEVIRAQHSYLDNSNGDLEKWVAQKLASLPSRATSPRSKTVDPQVLNSIIAAINSCAANTDAFLVGAQLDHTGKADSKFILGGAITLDNRPGTVARDSKNPREATLLAFFFDGADEEIRRISPNPTASFSVAADSIRSHKSKVAQAKATEAAEEEAAKKRSAEAAAYEASPEGQLLYSYQHFQIVQHCHEMRKGLALQFVNANEMADYKSKMKQIEVRLKGALKDGNTDRLWQLAEKNNRSWGGMVFDGERVGAMDYFEVLTNNNKTNWVSAKSDCDIQAEAFRGMIKSALGNAPVKKSF